MNKHVCHRLEFDISQQIPDIRNHYLTALRRAEKQLLDLMEREVLKTVYGNGPGKPRWREALKNSLTVLEEAITDNYIGAKVGADIDVHSTDFIRAMIVAYGGGSSVGNSPIKAGPYGRMVWNNELDDRKASEEETEWYLPEEFNQKGNMFVQNAVRLMRKHFDDILTSASYELPDSIFYNNLLIK